MFTLLRVNYVGRVFAVERALLARLNTPGKVQRYLNRLPYNTEPGGRATLRSFRGVVSHGCPVARFRQINVLNTSVSMS